MVWMRDRITKALGVQDHPEALETLMSEHHDEFQPFLDDEVNDVSDIEKCILYIYRTFYDRLVEREVVTIEKGKSTDPRTRDSSEQPQKILFIVLVPRIMTPPPPPVQIEFQKKGKKGKGKRTIFISPKISNESESNRNVDHPTINRRLRNFSQRLLRTFPVLISCSHCCGGIFSASCCNSQKVMEKI